MRTPFPRACAIAVLLMAAPAVAQIHLHDREGLTREEYEAIRDADVLCADGWRELRRSVRETRRPGRRMALAISLGAFDEDFDAGVAHDLLNEYSIGHPGVATRYERVGGLEELAATSRAIGESGEVIEALWVFSHGNQYGGEPILFFRSSDGRGTYESASVVALALAGLRFAPDASVFFHGCRLLAEEGPENLALLADAMGLTTGRIYANETLGFAFREEISPSVGLSNPTNCSRAVAALIVSPFFEFLDTMVFNRGWTLIRLPDGHRCSYRIHGRDMLRWIQAE